jgi:hypothetical protein
VRRDIPLDGLCRQERRGNLGGNAQRTRHIFNKAFLEALAKDFQEGGAQAIAKVRKEQPAAYMKICALLVLKELKLEHTGGVKSMTDEQLERRPLGDVASFGDDTPMLN